MSLCTHAVHRAVPFFRSVPKSFTPREPLLFLYPRWARTAATAAQGHEDKVNINPTSTLENHAFDSSRTKTDDYLHSSEEDPTSHDNLALNSQVECTKKHSPSKQDLQELVLLKTTEKLLTADRNTLPRRQSTSEKTEKKLYGSGVQIEKIIDVLKTNSLRKDHKRMNVEKYQEERRIERGAALPNWRSILRDLDLYTPSQSGEWHSHALKVLVPASSVEELIFGLNDNIWEIKRRTGCQIEVSAVDEDTTLNDQRALLLSGSVRSISQATAELVRLAPGSICSTTMTERKAPTFKTESKPESALGGQIPILRIRSEQYKSLAIAKRADLVEKPAEWTTRTFSVYVQRLTSMKISAHMQLFLYGSRNTHVHMVLYLLDQLFFDPMAQDAISVTAFNDAISYMMRHGQVKLARQLYVRMEMLDLPVNTESFNIMLRGCVASNDLGTFHFLLKMMLHRGYTPDAMTWLALIQTVRLPEIKQHVFDCMKKKELLQNPAIRRKALEELVTEDILKSFQLKMTLDEFLQHMSSHYEGDWLNIGSANRVLHILASYGQVSRCWDFVQYMHSQKVSADTISYNTILSQCLKHGNIEGALQLFSLMASVKMPSLKDSTYEILFAMAWEAQSYNLILVLWRYACLGAVTSFKMRKHILKAMKSTSKDGAGDWTTKLAANIMPRRVGKIMHPVLTPEMLTPETLTLESSKLDIRHAVDPLGASPSFRKINKFRTLLGNQMQQGIYWKPVRPLPEMLLAALDVDKEYISSGACDLENEQSLAWLKEHAVEIPLTTRLAKKVGGQHEVRAFW